MTFTCSLHGLRAKIQKQHELYTVYISNSTLRALEDVGKNTGI